MCCLSGHATKFGGKVRWHQLWKPALFIALGPPPPLLANPAPCWDVWSQVALGPPPPLRSVPASCRGVQPQVIEDMLPFSGTEWHALYANGVCGWFTVSGPVLSL